MAEGSERVKEYFRMVDRPFGGAARHSGHHGRVFISSRRIEHAEVSEGWELAFEEALNNAADILAERQEESATRLRALEAEVAALKQQPTQGNKTILVPVGSLAPEPYVLRREINVLVLPDDDSYVATFVDANINASGDTVPEAVANLKDMMVSLFERLSKEPRDKLGKWPARQLAVLQELIQRKTKHAAHKRATR